MPLTMSKARAAAPSKEGKSNFMTDFERIHHDREVELERTVNGHNGHVYPVVVLPL